MAFDLMAYLKDAAAKEQQVQQSAVSSLSSVLGNIPALGQLIQAPQQQAQTVFNNAANTVGRVGPPAIQAIQAYLQQPVQSTNTQGGVLNNLAQNAGYQNYGNFLQKQLSPQTLQQQFNPNQFNPQNISNKVNSTVSNIDRTLFGFDPSKGEMPSSDPMLGMVGPEATSLTNAVEHIAPQVLGAGKELLSKAPQLAAAAGQAGNVQLGPTLTGDAAKTLGKSISEDLGQISKWQEALPNEATANRLYRYLDGQNIMLTGKEQTVADAAKKYIADTAGKMGLPKDLPLSSYLGDVKNAAQFDPYVDSPAANQNVGVFDALKSFAKKMNVQSAVTDLGKPVEQIAQDAQSELPVIDRTKLTGKQLDVSSEELAARQASYQGNPKPLQELLARRQQEIPESPTEMSSLKPNQTPSLNSPGLQTAANQKLSLDSGGSLSDIINLSNLNVKNKVGILDYLRTPENVLNKMGLGDEAQTIRRAYDGYQKELPEQLSKITDWAKQVSPEGNVKIFQSLDGKNVQLAPNEQKVAGEIQDYLKHWAVRLGLPPERRISSYITHVFAKGAIEKEFDPELAKIIRDRVPGSVYDPFTEQRLGKQGYIEDTWRALDAYVKRAVRKANMDPALEMISKRADNLEESQFNYVKRYVSNVNMRPTEIENLVDNFIKSTPVGYRFGQRPTTALTQGARQMIYRGTLGLNVGSAIKNLQQGTNTYAKLGEKYTLIGYTQALKALATGSKELENSGVLGDSVIQDRTLSATKRLSDGIDKGLFSLFETAEKINRGAAYFGAKSQGLSKGMSEQDAIDYARKLVRSTQFSFSKIDTPVAMGSDVAKTLGQFQSYNIKQGEFLAGMVKNKDVAGLARWIGSNLVLLNTVGKAIGMKPADLIPSVKVGGSPLFQLGNDIGQTVTNAKDKYGNQPKLQDRVNTLGKDLIPFIPAGVQANKSLSGLDYILKGGSFTPKGQMKFQAPTDPMGALKAILFGPNNSSQAQQYYNSNSAPLSTQQTQKVQNNPSAYQLIQKQREQAKLKKQQQKHP